jgi:hypothetical protein
MQVDERKVRTTVDKVIALRRLTALTGTRTTRSQGELLQVLNTDEMVLAAQLLTKDGQTNEHANSK